MQRSPQFDSTADDLVLLELDDRSDDFDLRFGARAFTNHILKGSVIFGAAIGIAGTVFGDGTDVDRVGANGFGPAHRDGKKVRVAKRDVSDWDVAAIRTGRRMQLILGDRDALIGESRAA